MSRSIGRRWDCCEECLRHVLAGWQAPAGSGPVWVEFALLARSGRQAAAQLDLDGAGLSDLQADRYPFWPGCSLAARVGLTAAEARQPHVLELHLLDRRGTLCDWSSDFLPPLGGPSTRLDDTAARIPLLLPLHERIGFERPGRYALVLLCDGTTLASLPLSVG